MRYKWISTLLARGGPFARATLGRGNYCHPNTTNGNFLMSLDCERSSMHPDQTGTKRGHKW